MNVQYFSINFNQKKEDAYNVTVNGQMQFERGMAINFSEYLTDSECEILRGVLGSVTERMNALIASQLTKTPVPPDVIINVTVNGETITTKVVSDVVAALRNGMRETSSCGV